MHIARTLLAGGITLAPALAGLAAQQNGAIPVRTLSAPVAATTAPLGLVFGVRHLPGGKLLVNDASRRQVVVFDESLTSRSVTIDSTPGTPNSYGPRSAPIIPYLGDSTLFVDMTSQSLLVIGPDGRIARVMAAPRPDDLMFLSQSGSAVDARGRLIYRGAQRMAMPAGGRLGEPQTMTPPDSAPVVRADFESGRLDTIGRVRTTGGTRVTTSFNAAGQRTAKIVMNPVMQVDEWAVLADGSVAFVRGADYHIDWIDPDDSRRSTAKMPFDWRRLQDEDKQALIDSARTAQEAARSRVQAGIASGNVSMDVAAARAGAEVGRQVIVMGAASAAGGGGGGGAAPAAPMNMMVPEVEFVPLNEIPDYFPPIRPGAARADLDGNLWILPTTSAQSQGGELVYDVVNRDGKLFQRVRVPSGRSLAGFGPGGIVYLMWRDGDAGWHIERTRLLDATTPALPQ